MWEEAVIKAGHVEVGRRQTKSRNRASNNLKTARQARNTIKKKYNKIIKEKNTSNEQ